MPHPASCLSLSLPGRRLKGGGHAQLHYNASENPHLPVVPLGPDGLAGGGAFPTSRRTTCQTDASCCPCADSRDFGPAQSPVSLEALQGHAAFTPMTMVWAPKPWAIIAGVAVGRRRRRQSSSGLSSLSGTRTLARVVGVDRWRGPTAEGLMFHVVVVIVYSI